MTKVALSMNRLIRAIKTGNSVPARAARSVLRAILRPRAPRLPRFLKPFFRALYEIRYVIIAFFRMLRTVFYHHLLFQSRCASFGRNVTIGSLPFVSGHTEIHIGDDVSLGGGIFIVSGRWLDRPRLIIKDRAQIGWGVELSVNQEIVIEEDARVASHCRLSDNDGHPRQADLRAQDAPMDMRDIRPIRICRYAWIGSNSHIMKGVTIGEGAVIAANSVVISNVPPYALAMGNPAEVYFRNFGRPTAAAAAANGKNG